MVYHLFLDLRNCIHIYILTWYLQFFHALAKMFMGHRNKKFFKNISHMVNDYTIIDQLTTNIRYMRGPWFT